MNASGLISELQSLIEAHGDLAVTLVIRTHEYSASDIGFVDEGPLPNVGEMQRQNPPPRFVIAAEDDLDEV